MQSWPLYRKIQVTQTRLIEWYQKNNGNVYVSFSGGKDSSVLADIAAQVCKLLGYKLVLWFSNTGLEYPEVVEHARKFPEMLRAKYEIEVEYVEDYPKDREGKRVTFKDVIEKYGYPVASKEISQVIEEARRNASTGKYAYRIKRLNGELLDKNGNKSRYNCENWKFLMQAPFLISHKCCNVMKKTPAKTYEKETGRKPIVATMTCESANRKTAWLLHGCNAFDVKRQISQPMAFWTTNDVLLYIQKYNIPIASVYGDVVEIKGKLQTTGCDRTGCMWCLFGIQREKSPNRLERLKETHPKIYNYIMKPESEGGFGYKDKIDWMNEHGNLNIKY